jgi:hypothetical protein
VLRVDAADRKIALSRKQIGMPDEPPAEETPEAGTKPKAPRASELRGGTGSGGGQLISMPDAPKPDEPKADEPKAEGNE